MSHRRKRPRLNKRTLVEGDPELVDIVTHEVVTVTRRGKTQQKQVVVPLPSLEKEVGEGSPVISHGGPAHSTYEESGANMDDFEDPPVGEPPSTKPQKQKA